jgi:hypothetical protein
MTDLTNIQSFTGEIILSENISSSEFLITAIHEDIKEKTIKVEVEMGPFQIEEMPDGTTTNRGISQRMLVVWEGSSYDAIKNTWDNVALNAKVSELLAEQARAQIAK